MITYRFKIKNPPGILRKMAMDVNFVWNYCNDVSMQYLDKQGKWLSGYDLQALTRGCAEELSIHSQTIQMVGHNYSARRKFVKKRALSWRSRKRSLGWIPLNIQSFKIENDTIIHQRRKLKFWKSRDIVGRILSASINEDSRGKWYLNVACEQEVKKIKSGGAVGIDLGFKTLATLSDGTKLERDNITSKYADRLALAQRARKKRLTKSIHAKIKNKRKDWAHKETTKLINRFDKIVVGDVSPAKLKKTRMAKSVSDAGWYDFKTMLAYKAIALGVEYKEVKENFSTVTCSSCFERTGPSGLSALGVREWICKCGASHNRDVNAAKNILRISHDTPIKGVPSGNVPRTSKRRKHI